MSFGITLHARLGDGGVDDDDLRGSEFAEDVLRVFSSTLYNRIVQGLPMSTSGHGKFG